MIKLKIDFVDFYDNFNKIDNFIMRTLRLKYDVEISDNPDYLFFSTFGYKHLHYSCVKIMFIGENIAPDFNLCDYALAFDYIQFGDRYMRLPLYCTYECFSSIADKQKKQQTEDFLLNRKFCSIVVSNNRHSSPLRERFFRLLSEYKQVDSGGKMWNNVGGPVVDKLLFLRKYKFNIAFENSSVLGYTTEKIMEPMTVNTLPIYWGNPLVDKDFNPESFVNVHNFPSMEDAVQYIVDLDNDDVKYLQMLHAPRILEPMIKDWQENLLAFLSNIIDKPLNEAKYLTSYGHQKIYRRKQLILKLDENVPLKKVLRNRICGLFNRSK